MKLPLSVVAVVVRCSFSSALAQPQPAEPVGCAEPLPRISAQQVLDAVVDRLPQEPLMITGELTVRKQRGVVVEKLNFDVSASWGSEPVVVRYTIRDAVGNDLEQLNVFRAAGKSPTLSYARGNPLSPATPPDMFKCVGQTDISWMDLTLSFLWWRHASIVRIDEVKGRTCYVVRVSPTADANSPTPARPDQTVDSAVTDTQPAQAVVDASKQYSHAILWIDKERLMLLQAEGYNAHNELVRRLWIKSFKKINNMWMIKDMEIQKSPPIHRTKLRIREVTASK